MKKVIIKLFIGIQILVGGCKFKSDLGFELIENEKDKYFGYNNLHFLVKTENPDSLLMIGKKILNDYCKSQKCDIIRFWNSKEGYKLSVEGRNLEEDEEWKNKNFIKVCDSFKATIENNVIYRYTAIVQRKDEYIKYGGKKSIPIPAEINIDDEK